MQRQILSNNQLRSLAIDEKFDSIYEGVIESAEKGLTFYKFDVEVKYEKYILEIIAIYFPEVRVEKIGVSEDRYTYANILYKINWKD